jgi:NADPH:quinone reductase-like Zn-dependent oxidoreductase
MRAITFERYGPLEVLHGSEIQQPELGRDEVLVRVRAAGLHVGDCFAIKGSPFVVRFYSGLRRPRFGVPGFDLAGEVADVGAGVTRWRPGDLVFGCGVGTCADFARARQDHLVSMPVGLTSEQGAAIPTSGLAALHGLRDAGRIAAGQRVLVNGASGGVGTFAIQIAKVFGAEVTGVCSTANVDLVRSIGADHAIDYTREDFTRLGPRYDLILDNIENRPLADVRRALAPHGTLVLNSGTGAAGMSLLARLAAPIVRSPFTSQSLRRFVSNPNLADLEVLKGLVEDGKIRPVIDRTYPLAETPAALRHIEAGHARGKVVVSVAS